MVIKRAHFDLEGRVVFGQIIFKPPFRAGEALHDEARFVTVINGRSQLFLPNIQLDLGPSDSFIMKCENFVNNWLPNADDEPNEAIIVHFYPDMLKTVYGEKLPDVFSSGPQSASNPVEKIEMNAMIRNFVDSLRYYFDYPEFMTDDLIKIKIRELVLIMVNCDASGKIKAVLSELFKSREYEFKEIIHSHLYDDLRLQELAFFAGLSLSSFKRKFNAVFGTSPTRYIKHKRLEKAQNMLQMSTQRVSEVAYACGFNDVAYFSKTFSSVYNCTPSAYRKHYLDQISKELD